ncbi:MAG: MFS transporter [Chloroflexi bacterium]|nr:MFS transporter [Chloroflexota bacterium]
MRPLKNWLVVHFPALSSRDYVLFLIGQFVSVIGTWMQATALPYLAYRISGRPLDLGLIGFSNTLPTLLFALPAGVLVERWDKRKTVILFQAIMSIQAFGLAYLAYTNQIQIWHIVTLAFFYGSAVAVEVTARQAMLIELAGRESLPSAIALQTTAFNLGRVLGPLSAAWLISATGSEGSVFLVNGISFIFVIAGLFLARTRFKTRTERSRSLENEANPSQGMGSEFREGLVYIRRNAVVLSAILMSALLGFFGIPLLQQLPALARDVLRTALDTESLIAARTSSLYTAQGVGAVLAAFMVAYLSSANKSKMLLWGQAAFIFPVIALGVTAKMNLDLVLLAFIGWGTVTQLVTMNTMIQMQVPNDLRGRVFSIYFWALQGVAPFGSIMIGWIAQTWNVQTAIVAGGTICLLGIAFVRLIFMQRKQTSA